MFYRMNGLCNETERTDINIVAIKFSSGQSFAFPTRGKHIKNILTGPVHSHWNGSP